MRTGEKPGTIPSATSGLLSMAQDWQLFVGLGRQLKFPKQVVRTSLRPDMVLVSEETKNIAILELTALYEKRMEEAFKWKTGKYNSLISNCHRQGRGARCFPVEVYCRGFAGQFLW